MEGVRDITIIAMYITLMPVIIAGVLNMIWVKSSFLKSLYIPLDGGKKFYDGKRIFGENKTFKGFIGMIIWAVLATVLWGWICSLSEALNTNNYIYLSNENNISFNVYVGFLYGLAYAVFELPNSFIKRRINIVPGKKATGLKGVLFVFIDQADSILGCLLVLEIFYPMTIGFYFLFLFIGAFTHIVINIILYSLNLRRNMFWFFWRIYGEFERFPRK